MNLNIFQGLLNCNWMDNLLHELTNVPPSNTAYQSNKFYIYISIYIFIKIKKYYANCHQQLVANLSLILQTVPSSSSVQPVVDLTGKGNCIIVTLLNCNIYFLLLPVLPGFFNQTTIAMMK